MAYSELVSGGVSKSHTFEVLVKVGASKGVIRVDLKKNLGRGGVSGQPENPLDTPLKWTLLVASTALRTWPAVKLAGLPFSSSR